MGKEDLTTSTLSELIFHNFIQKFFCFKYTNDVFSAEPTLMPAVTEPPNYKSSSVETITVAIKFPNLSPYNPGSQLESRRTSNQLSNKPRS